MAERWDPIADILRRRVRRGVQAGTLRRGDRLPSARALAVELNTDPRQVAGAYRDLEREGLVELRARGGVYVALRSESEAVVPTPDPAWLAGILSEAVAREVPLLEVPGWLERALGAVTLHAVVVAATSDQASGLCRELQDDFGLRADALLADDLAPLLGDAGLEGGDVPAELRDAALVVTTESLGAPVARLAGQLGVPCVVTTVRPDLIGGEWQLLLRHPLWVVVADARFEATLRRFLEARFGAENLRTLVVGRDDVATIPDGAPTYVTRGARERLGATRIPGRILPATRTISRESSREIIEHIVRANLRALASSGDD